MASDRHQLCHFCSVGGVLHWPGIQNLEGESDLGARELLSLA